jgi:hypothetical protein
MIRDDLSNKLIHLTRGEEAAETFKKILDDKKLIGNDGNIKGSYKCVCFSEAPISKLSLILAQTMAHDMRYKPFGVMVDKEWLFDQGGRPVIYQSNAEYDLLDENQKYRHVRYEPSNKIDFTWEREWRIQTDNLLLDPEHTTVIVPNREEERRVLQPHEDKIWRRAAVGMLGGMPSSTIKSPWHFIVLEDLGVKIHLD